MTLLLLRLEAAAPQASTSPKGNTTKTGLVHQLAHSVLQFTGASLQVRKLSVKEITVPQCYDALKNAQPGGPYDKALGPMEVHDRCGTVSALSGRVHSAQKPGGAEHKCIVTQQTGLATGTIPAEPCSRSPCLLYCSSDRLTCCCVPAQLCHVRASLCGVPRTLWACGPARAGVQPARLHVRTQIPSVCTHRTHKENLVWVSAAAAACASQYMEACERE